jgi:hypothetical protein
MDEYLAQGPTVPPLDHRPVSERPAQGFFGQQTFADDAPECLRR